MTVEKAQAALQAVLKQAFDERLPVRGSLRAGGAVELRVDHGSKTHRLVGHWVRGWPSDVRALLTHIGRPWPKDHVALSSRFSPGAIALLDDVGANWGELTGRGRLRTRDGIAVRTGDSAPKSEVPGAGSLRWSPARADVAEVLLARRSVPRHEELKGLTGWSVPQIGQTLHAFDRQGWTRRSGAARGRGATREIVEWEPMLESWAAYLAKVPRQGIAAHATYRDPLTYIEQVLLTSWNDLRWSVSGWAGLQMTAPFLTSVPRVQLYVDVGQFHARLPRALRAAGLREVTEGSRVDIWPARPAVFSGAARRPSGVSVVHATRLYADLLAMGDRGREAAVHVREELLDGG